MNTIFKLCLSLLVLLSATIAKHAYADSKTLEQNFKQNYPDLSIDAINPAPMAGMYEVYVDGELIYTDESAQYLLFGNLLDVKNKRNLTEEHLNQLNKIDVTKLPLNQAIQYSKGKGERTLYIFSDPDCPYCQKLEHYMTNIDNVKVYVFLYPLTQLHPKAKIAAQQIWCATDRAKAWEDYLLNRKLANNPGQCATPIQKNLDLGQTLKITGTPTIFLENGERISGIPQDASQLEQLIQQASTQK